ncbi:MAG: hypothetical protein NTZ16_12615 [Verrucomicrobia bacterium]|nr:hypothetical protein [Verrucomicrobiota bacterium]
MNTKSILYSLSSILALALLAGCGTMRDAVPVTTLTIDPVTHNVALSNPKDTTIKNFHAEVTTNGSVVTFDSLTTVMNPDVITTTGDAQAKMIAATGEAVTKAVAAAGTAALAAGLKP